ncbi:hypothetical protein QEG73_01145 [Chitinophagaceae bacterium 26-R-25]|nr:hypothetical protein [Chitinophagaceae bacterium 26-R-25]
MSKYYFTIAVISIIVFASGCKKVYDYIDHHPTSTCDACQVVQLTAYYHGDPTVFSINYDKKGNVTSIIGDRDHPEYDYYIRYDKQNRVSDIISIYHGNTGAVTWETFRYFPGKIVDTIYAYAGLITDPNPPYDAYNKNYAVLKTDDLGRVISRVFFIPLAPNNPQSIIPFPYNSIGNLVLPGTIADNKINPNRTNKLWQLMSLDYSVNNIVYDPAADSYYIQDEKPVIISYNTYGLPIKYKTPKPYASPRVFGIVFDSMTVKYDCDFSGINY